MIFYNKIMLVMEKQYQRLWFLISFCVVSFYAMLVIVIIGH